LYAGVQSHPKVHHSLPFGNVPNHVPKLTQFVDVLSDGFAVLIASVQLIPLLHLEVDGEAMIE
jgi:hypothetical protein